MRIDFIQLIEGLLADLMVNRKNVLCDHTSEKQVTDTGMTDIFIRGILTTILGNVWEDRATAGILGAQLLVRVIWVVIGSLIGCPKTSNVGNYTRVHEYLITDKIQNDAEEDVRSKRIERNQREQLE
jgi:hypothetical protein